MRLRSDDPATMKSFIVSIQNKVAELKASGDSQGNSRSKRVCVLLFHIFAYSRFCSVVASLVTLFSSCLADGVHA